MAIYRFEAKIISRGGGRSAVASAAYRAGGYARRAKSIRGGHSVTAAAAYRSAGKLTNELTGEIHDFSKKRGVRGAQILIPAGAPAWMEDRAALWNAVEKIEKRKDSQLARDFIVSLPHELSDEQRIALMREFVQEQFCDRGYVADVAWHAPDRAESLNHHAHVMVTLRRVDGASFAATKERPPVGQHPSEFWKIELSRLRKVWAATANRHLEAAGLDIRIDHRSLEARGIDREPEPKQGPVATQIEKEGRESYAGRDRRAARLRNAERARLKVEHARAVFHQAQITNAIKGQRGRADMAFETSGNDDENSVEAAKIKLSTIEARRQRIVKEAAAQIGPQAKANADRQVAQAEELQKEHNRVAARINQLSIFNIDREQIAAEHRRQLAAMEAEVQEEAITDAKSRYGQALGDHYDIRDPYGSLARSAMAEYGTFMRQRGELNRRIADEKDPEARRTLELRRDIESCDYMSITCHRIAGQSEVIVGRSDTEEAVHQRERAAIFEERAKDLRQQYRDSIRDQELAKHPATGELQPEEERSSEKEKNEENEADRRPAGADGKAAASEREPKLGPDFEP